MYKHQIDELAQGKVDQNLPSSVFLFAPPAVATFEPLRRDVGGRGTPRSFVEQRQASLDQRYGAGKYVVPWCRERARRGEAMKGVLGSWR